MNLSRRRFLTVAGITGPAAFVLASCGGDGDGAADTEAPTGETDGTLPDGFAVVQHWFPTWLVPGALRLPVSLADTDGVLPSGPPEILGRILDATTGDVVVTDLVGVRRSVSPGSVPYWVFEATVEAPGLYALQLLGGDVDGAALQVLEPDKVTIATPGDPLMPFDTPTTDDGRGVDPICTLLPEPCPFHRVTLTEALRSGRPVAFLVGTPAHCSTGTCSPALEALVALGDEYADRVTMVHAEIFTDDTATVSTPLVQAYGMDYEPSLFVTDATGVVVERLDAVFNGDEIRSALDRVV